MPEQSPLHELAAQAGAVFTEYRGWSVPDNFGDPAGEYQAARTELVLFDFSPRGKVELAGTEAVSFLHNLCSNDIKGLKPGTSCEAFLTTAKARLIAPMYVTRDDDKILWLDTEPGLAETICQHLTRYRISEDVTITDRTRDLALLHLCGPKAPTLAPGQLPPVHSGEHGAFLPRRHDLLNLPGFDLFCRAAEAKDLWTTLVKAGAKPAGMGAFETLRVEAGIPLFDRDMDADRLVMEIGRTQQAISFNKGCYLGQESIVMARDRGHVNRQLLGLRIPQGGPVAAGTKVLKDGEEIGQVTSSVQSPQLGMAIALAYLKRGCQTPGLAVDIAAGQERRPAIVAELPFV